MTEPIDETIRENERFDTDAAGVRPTNERLLVCMCRHLFLFAFVFAFAFPVSAQHFIVEKASQFRSLRLPSCLFLSLHTHE